MELDHKQFCFLKGVLSNSDCAQLVRASAEMTWGRLPPIDGRVRQEAEMAACRLVSGPSIVQELGDDLRNLFQPWLVQRFGDRGSEWPNEAAYMRYSKGEGIALHRDFVRYGFLIAIMSLTGSAHLEIASGTPRSIVVDRGTLVLLRGSGIGERPSHCVTNIGRQNRISLTYRYDIQLADPSGRGN